MQLAASGEGDERQRQVVDGLQVLDDVGIDEVEDVGAAYHAGDEVARDAGKADQARQLAGDQAREDQEAEADHGARHGIVHRAAELKHADERHDDEEYGERDDPHVVSPSMMSMRLVVNGLMKLLIASAVSVTDTKNVDVSPGARKR